MQLIKYNVKIDMLSPFNISSGEDQDGYIDRSTVTYRGCPYIPGSTIKGKIRSNFYKISDIDHVESNCRCPMCLIFGGEGYSPSKIYIDDFRLDEDSNGELSHSRDFSIKYGNAINRYTKTAKDNALFVQEVANKAKFVGQVSIYFDSETIKYKDNLELAMNMIDSIGGGRSRGYGRAKVYLEEVEE